MQAGGRGFEPRHLHNFLWELLSFRWARVGAFARVLRPLVSEGVAESFRGEAPLNQVLFFDKSGCGKSCNSQKPGLSGVPLELGLCESLHEP